MINRSFESFLLNGAGDETTQKHGPWPRGTRIKGVHAWYTPYEVAGVFSARQRAKWAIVICNSASQMSDSNFTAMSGVGRVVTTPSSQAVGGSQPAGICEMPLGVPVFVPLDLVIGEDDVEAIAVYFSGQTTDAVGVVASAIEFELPRTVNARQLSSPPVPVAKDEG